MRVVAIIQARMSSQRLPGKVLLRLDDRPLIEHLCEALRHARTLDQFVLATSIEPSDDAIAYYAREHDIRCHRGSLDHVAERMLAAARDSSADVLVRISGDSPLLDPMLIDQAVDLFLREGTDIVTNVRPRSFPKGQSVEVMSATAFAQAVARMSTVEEREHVTPYFYAHPEQFNIRSIVATRPRPEVQLSVDTAKDLARCESIMRRLPSPPWQAGWEACVAQYDAVAAAS